MKFKVEFKNKFKVDQYCNMQCITKVLAICWIKMQATLITVDITLMNADFYCCGRGEYGCLVLPFYLVKYQIFKAMCIKLRSVVLFVVCFMWIGFQRDKVTIQ